MFLGSSKYIKDKTFYCGKSKNILFCEAQGKGRAKG